MTLATLATLKEKARAWWAGINDKTGLAILVVGSVLAVLIIAGPRPAAQQAAEPELAASPGEHLQDQIDTLRLRVATLEAAADAPQDPDPQPPRASAPRAAVRPTSPPAAPAASAPRWGTTDLDRAIAAFPSTKPLEQAK